MTGEQTSLDGSKPCYLDVRQAGFDERQLETVIDSATDDNLVVWLTKSLVQWPNTLSPPCSRAE
jgi:hypothetical protein